MLCDLQIVIDYPYEVLTHITGYYAPTMVMGPNIIKSLTFHTTKTKYGPFGEEQGTPFSSNIKEGVIVGFHGRTGLFIDAIGVHMIEGKARPPTRPPSNKQLNQNQSQIQVLDNAAEVDRPLWYSNKSVPTKGGPFEEVLLKNFTTYEYKNIKLMGKLKCEVIAFLRLAVEWSKNQPHVDQVHGVGMEGGHGTMEYFPGLSRSI